MATSENQLYLHWLEAAIDEAKKVTLLGKL